MLIAARNGFLAGGKLSAKSYVQDGLVAMWDGIENAGWGVHDANATVWKDLVGTRDAILEGAYMWGEDYWHVESATNGGLARWNASNLGSSQTIEFVIHPYRAYGDYNSYGRVLAEGQSVPSPCIAWRFNHAGFDAPYMFGYGLDNAGPAIQGFDIRQKMAHSIVHPANSAMKYYLNRDLAWSSDTSGNSTGVRYGYFANRSSLDRGIDADYFTIRIYSCVLTAEELAANYAIDKERFNLP